MSESFWKTIKHPFHCLAPMAGITETCFRRVIARLGRPDVFFTPFVSCDGICSPARDILMQGFRYTEEERPIVAQLFGATPANFHATAKICLDLGFDGIDINAGCPDRNVEKQRSGAQLMKTPALTQEIIAATRQGVNDQIPVSIKTRLGYEEDVIDQWLPVLLDAKPAAITIHGRTRSQLYHPPVRWESVARAVRIAQGSGIPIIGNGDLWTIDDCRRVVEETGVDGTMIARGITRNPWFFDPTLTRETVPWTTRLDTMRLHTRIYVETYGEGPHFVSLRKFFKAYVSEMTQSKELRLALMQTTTTAEVYRLLYEYTRQHS